MQKKLTILILIAVTLTVLTISPIVKADTSTQFGTTSYTPINFAYSELNALGGASYSTSGWTYDEYIVINGSAYVGTVAGTANAKIVIVNNATNEIVATSNAITGISTTFSWRTFTFTGEVHLLKSVGAYVLAFIPDDTDARIKRGEYANIILYDATNSYASPSNPTDGTNYNSAEISIYLNLYGIVAATPTPLPTPVPSTDLWTGTWIENIITIILPLALILIPAFLGWKFAKAWGFFAGLNVGVILCYVYGQMVPLWGVIVMVVADGLLLFGKVGMHD